MICRTEESKMGDFPVNCSVAIYFSGHFVSPEKRVIILVNRGLVSFGISATGRESHRLEPEI